VKRNWLKKGGNKMDIVKLVEELYGNVKANKVSKMRRLPKSIKHYKDTFITEWYVADWEVSWYAADNVSIRNISSISDLRPEDIFLIEADTSFNSLLEYHKRLMITLYELRVDKK
jgi:hypothetical protein